MVRTVSRGNPHTAHRAPGAPTRLRPLALFTPLALAALLAGCGAGPAPITVGAGEPADGMVAGPMVTSPPPAGTDSIALSDADSTSSTGTGTGPNGAAGTGRPPPPACPSVTLDATGPHVASQLRAYGLSCDAAAAAARTISAGQPFSAGSTTFAQAGFRCVTRVSVAAAPSADYDCSRADGGRVRWHRT